MKDFKTLYDKVRNDMKLSWEKVQEYKVLSTLELPFLNFESLSDQEQFVLINKLAMISTLPKQMQELVSFMQETYLEKGKYEVLGDHKVSFSKFTTLSNNAQLKLINEISKIKDLPKELRDLVTLKQVNYLDTLPKELVKEVSSYLNRVVCFATNTELAYVSKLVQVDKSRYALFPVMDRLLSVFLGMVTQGIYTQAEKIFSSLLKSEDPKIQETKTQKLLCSSGTITDSSGRVFECTAYEYAYWAKDTYMRGMLEKHMNADTKAAMLRRCTAIERNGLTYVQHGIVKNSKHFDPTPLITALEDYIKAAETHESIDYKSVSEDERSLMQKLLEGAWSKVLSAIDDLPANWNQTIYNRSTGLEDYKAYCWTWSDLFHVPEGPGSYHLNMDIEELVSLDKARTTDLKSSLVSLETSAPRDETSPRL